MLNNVQSILLVIFCQQIKSFRLFPLPLKSFSAYLWQLDPLLLYAA